MDNNKLHNKEILRPLTNVPSSHQAFVMNCLEKQIDEDDLDAREIPNIIKTFEHLVSTPLCNKLQRKLQNIKVEDRLAVNIYQALLNHIATLSTTKELTKFFSNSRTITALSNKIETNHAKRLSKDIDTWKIKTAVRKLLDQSNN